MPPTAPMTTWVRPIATAGSRRSVTPTAAGTTSRETSSAVGTRPRRAPSSAGTRPRTPPATPGTASKTPCPATPTATAGKRYVASYIEPGREERPGSVFTLESDPQDSLHRAVAAPPGPSLPLPPLSRLTPARRERGGWKKQTNFFFCSLPPLPGRVGVRWERRAGEVRGLRRRKTSALPEPLDVRSEGPIQGRRESAVYFPQDGPALRLRAPHARPLRRRSPRRTAAQPRLLQPRRLRADVARPGHPWEIPGAGARRGSLLPPRSRDRLHLRAPRLEGDRPGPYGRPAPRSGRHPGRRGDQVRPARRQPAARDARELPAPGPPLRLDAVAKGIGARARRAGADRDRQRR